MEGAVQWIVSAGTNIYEAVQLNEDLSHLRSSLPKAHLLIDRGEWGRFKYKDLAPLLLHLKDTTFDAEDLLREFDDQVLQQKMEDTDRSRAGQLVSSSFNLFKVWTSGIKTRVKEAKSKLDMAVSATEGTLNFMGLNVEPAQLGKPLMPETSSVIRVPQVFGCDEERDLVIERLGVMIGRENERDQVIELLGVPLTKGGRSARAAGKKTASLGTRTAASASRDAKRLKGESSGSVSTKAADFCTDHVSILPIVGIGGMGKTTLAQFIYNDARVKTHFDMRLWVCVSDIFDKKRMTKELVKSTIGENFSSSGSLDDLQVKLKEQLMGQKFLLVLDDVWPVANNEWETFYAPFMSGLDGSMVLLTTRFPKVAKLVSTVKPIELEGLPTAIFREFFEKWAFGEQNPESYPQLQDIGQSIVGRLCSSPLAAKTLGRLLNMELTERHWRVIRNSELWELPHQENDILPALQLSYLYLPQELKRCFAICSMFPKDYSFQRHELIGIWVAEGFVVAGGSMHIEDVGSRYLDELTSRFLIISDPSCPHLGRYVVHDLIHDMAQSISVGECFLMQNSSQQKNLPKTVRHVSLDASNEALSRLKGLEHLNKLHSLRFGSGFRGGISLLNQLSNILFLSLKGCNLVKLSDSICFLNHLRHLDISYSSIKELPKDFGCLFSLQVLDATGSRLETVHEGIAKLVNLRHLELPFKAVIELSKISRLGNLSSLRNLNTFTVGTENGRKISELKGMNQLSGFLRIEGIHKVKSVAEAAEARLVDKQYLKTLTLNWRQRRCSLKTAENKVLEALRPPSGVKHLRVTHFAGDNFSPSWLKPENRPTVRSLELSECHSLRYFSVAFPPLEKLVLDKVCIEVLTTFADCITSSDVCSPHQGINRSNGTASLLVLGLTTLHLRDCNELKNLDRCLSPEYLPSIKHIELVRCSSLV